jgi:hypothetical protein
MKTVLVGFTHLFNKDRNGKPMTTSSSIVVADDVDRYDIHTEFEGVSVTGWVLSSIEVVEENVRIVRLNPSF